MTDLAFLLDYIDRSTESLNLTLKSIVTSQTLRYDIIYEHFLKSIEQYKINIFSELKTQLIPGYSPEESNSELGILQQMKLILNVKIRDCITELNLATTSVRKEEIIAHLGVLNDSLQKVEKNIFESKNLFSPLSQSMMSQNFTHLEEIDHGIESKNKTVITPLPQKKEKVSSDITSKLTPLLSGKKMFPAFKVIESAENKRLAPFKTPMQYSSGQSNTIPKSVSQITSAPKSEDTGVTNLNSFNKTNEKSDSTTPNQQKATNSQSVSLFEMFDNCLNSIVQNKNDALLANYSETTASHHQQPHFESKKIEIRDHSKSLSNTQFYRLSEILDNLTLRKSFNIWRSQASQISLPNFDNDFDLLHGNIAGMHELDMPKDHEEFYLKTKDFSLILNREDIMKDYNQDNLLSTQLSFCDGNMDDMNFEEMSRPKSSKPLSLLNLQSSKNENENLLGSKGDKSSRKIMEPTNFEETKPKTGTIIENRKTSIGSLISQNSSQKIKAGNGPIKVSISGNPSQALGVKSTDINTSSASKRTSRAIDEKKTMEKEKPKSTIRSSSNSRPSSSLISSTGTAKIPSTKALNSSTKISSSKENTNKVVSPMKSLRMNNYNSSK